MWWVRVDKRRPAVVVQSDTFDDPRVRSFLIVPLTSRLHLGLLPGNVRLSERATGLARESVANVYDLQRVLRSDMIERVGPLPAASLAALADGMRLVLGL